VAVVGFGPFVNQSRSFYYDTDDRLIAEMALTPDGETPLASYVYLAGEPLAKIVADGTVYYYHNDFTGTPQRMSQADGTVKWAARYSPFGELGAGDVNPAVDCQQLLVDNPLRLLGQYDDQRAGTGPWRYDARYTQPEVPPTAPMSATPMRNPYLLADGNPMSTAAGRPR
jgi:uncharacterized protein RhaS with RHS repeats